MPDLQVQKILEKLANYEKRIAKLEKLAIIPSSSANKEVQSAKQFTLGDIVISLINKIGEDEKSKEILEGRSMEAKILLCFYTSYKYFGNHWLTSGDIRKITFDLGVEIDQGNIANKFKKLRQYLQSSSIRQKGKLTSYRLNRRGIKYFKEKFYSEKA